MTLTKSNLNTQSQDKTSNLKVAIDGPAGAGKSTVAKLLADKLGFLYVDTGAMYRAATWLALEHGIDIDDGEAIARLAGSADIRLERAAEAGGHSRVFVNDKEITDLIRSRQISEVVSPVSAHASLRDVLVARQKEIARGGAVVLDGRDIGTVVMPEAEVKIFLTASPEARAQRRVKDLLRLGEDADFKTILQSIKERDHRDSTRTASPLIKADDAIELATDDLTIAQVVEKLLELCTRS
ncbi:MAG: (d)CMP kinase [Candidatus Obscuribacterales bacterium]|nr:(d)CMP kinase [Candidatus Obscuribacterales bacterium]